MRAMALLLVAFLLPANAVWAQTEERTVYASVVDKNDAPVPGLNAGAFIVRENDVAREVLRASVAHEPLQIALLIDTSQAIDNNILDIRTGLQAFFKQMAGKHEIALIGTGERPTVLVDYTRDPARLQAGVDRIFARRGSGAYLLDAIVEASHGLAKREGARSAIVTISTEGPEFSERYHQYVLDELRRSDARLYAVVLTRSRRSSLSRSATERDITLAEGSVESGGHRENVLTSMAFESTLQELATQINNQYRVVYARPGSLVPPEKVAVTVNRSDVAVRARRTPPTSRATF